MQQDSVQSRPLLDSGFLGESRMPVLHARITFCVRGLGEKDARLFKSFVRLISHRTSCEWVSSDDVGEVCVSPSPLLQQGSPHLLRVVSTEARSPFEVRMPFQAVELEQTLNDLGLVVLAARAHRPAATNLLPQRFKLTRWPAADMLRSAQRMRLATAMTGRETSLEELVQRTSVPLDACRAFCHELHGLGYLAAAADGPPPSAVTHRVVVHAPARPEAGLLARIRNRLSRI